MPLALKANAFRSGQRFRSHTSDFMLFSLPFRGAFQISLTVLVCYRSPVRYLALDRHHDPNSASTLKLTYSQARSI